MLNIQEIKQKIKNTMEDAVGEWGLIAIVLLVGLASFGLGRLSALEEARPAVSIRQAAAAGQAHGVVLGGLLVASRRGSAYHYPWCSGATSIAAGNRVWFESEAAARAAGYSPAKNCKGLQ